MGVVVETKVKKGSSEKKASSGARLNGGSKSNTATGVNGCAMMKSGAGSNGGSKSSAMESRVESASFSTLSPLDLSKLYMEKSTTPPNGELWKEWGRKEAAKGHAMREC